MNPVLRTGFPVPRTGFPVPLSGIRLNLEIFSLLSRIMYPEYLIDYKNCILLSAGVQVAKSAAVRQAAPRKPFMRIVAKTLISCRHGSLVYHRPAVSCAHLPGL
jgi:hypothetical protein